ncbi:MAG: ABC transporter permease [Vannielia sp.]|uniref:ABC transporter permease n=1 Tax=Rhodobacterales TaxID=204455 RepID=UPI002094EA5D|nr:ABC transporter permease [Oceanicola sp. 502str15]MCO6384118.1 ribose ABC transporter permease [Oceanicola sp. 502str15]
MTTKLENRTTIGTGDASGKARVRGLLDKLSTVFVFLAIMVLMEFLHSGFVTSNNLSLIALQSATRAVLAIGVMLVIISGAIDISVGTVMSLSMVVMGIAVIDAGLPLWLGFGAAIATGTLMGGINGFLIAYARLPAFIVTLGMLGIAQGLALFVSNGRSLYGFPESFEVVGGGKVLGLPVPVLILAAFAGLMLFVFYQTKVGRYAFTMGGSEEGTRRAGINVRRYRMGIFAISGATAGLASIILASRINSAHPGIGFGYELDAIAAVVIGGGSLMGGRGTVWGAIIGALIMSEIRFGLNVLGMSPFIQQIVVGVVLIAAVYIDTLRSGPARAR